MFVFVLLFVVAPLVELYVIVQVAGAIGVWNALGLLLAASLFGGWLVKRQGMAMWRRAQLQITAGHVPAKEVVNGFLLLFAGFLLLLPGFVSGAIGLLLLLPPVRAGVRVLLTRRWSGQVNVIRATYRGPIDTTATDATGVDTTGAGTTGAGPTGTGRRHPELGAP